MRTWKRYGRVSAAIGASVACLTLALTPSSLSAAHHRKASPKVTITFMEAMSSGTLKPALDTLVNQFEQSHPGIGVQLIVEPSYSVLEQKEQASIAANDPPTIGQAYEDWAATYAQSKAIVPLTPFVRAKKNGVTPAQRKDIWPTIWNDQFLPDGQMWMWPFNKSDFVLYYNADMLKAHHLAVPATWTEFAQVSKALVGSNTWAFSMDPGSTSGPANGTYLYVSLIRAMGGHIWVKKEPNFDSPQAVAAANYLLHLLKVGAMKLGTNYPGQTAMGAQKSAFDLSTIASYYYNVAADGGKFNMQVAVMPKGPGGQGNVLQGTNIVMFSKTTPAQREAAWTFMRWLTLPKQTAYWAVQTGYLPVDRSAIALMKTYFNTHPYQRIAAESLSAARSLPPVPGFEEATGALANALQEILIGHMPVAQALAQAEQQAKSDVAGTP